VTRTSKLANKRNKRIEKENKKKRKKKEEKMSPHTPHPDEPYYCSQQIEIPPQLPDCLKQFTKAEFRCWRFRKSRVQL